MSEVFSVTRCRQDTKSPGRDRGKILGSLYNDDRIGKSARDGKGGFSGGRRRPSGEKVSAPAELRLGLSRHAQHLCAKVLGAQTLTTAGRVGSGCRLRKGPAKERDAPTRQGPTPLRLP